MSEPYSEAAANLIEYLESFGLNSEEYPKDLEILENRELEIPENKDLMIPQNGSRRATTLDGRHLTISPQDWDQNLRRGRNGFPYFGKGITNDRIIALMIPLKDAVQLDEKNSAGELLFGNEWKWRGYMISLAIQFLEGSLNPPELDLVRFPHRVEYKDYAIVDGYKVSDGEGGCVYSVRKVETVVWRYRAAQEGFVHHAYLAYIADADRRKQADRRIFERLWIDEFVENNRAFNLNGVRKSMDDFVVGGRTGTPGEFRAYWRIVSNPRYKSGGPTGLNPSPNPVPAVSKEL